MAEPFRVAQPVVESAPAVEEKPAEPAVVSPDADTPAVDTPPARDNPSVPLVAEYLEIGNIWDRIPSMKREVDGMQGYLNEMITAGKLERSPKAVKEFMTELESKAEVRPYESVNQRITRILAYIKFRRIVDN